MKRIMFTTDFSPSVAAAEREAVRLARARGAELVLAHVAGETPRLGSVLSTPEVRTVFESARQWAADALAKRVTELAAEGLTARSVVRSGEPADEIVRLADEEHADMIVMGTQGRTGLERLMLGSVAERVIRRSRCPVLTVRPDVNRGTRR